MCVVHVSHFSRSTLQHYFESSFVIIGNDKLDTSENLWNCEEVLQMVKPKRRDRHVLASNGIEIVTV